MNVLRFYRLNTIVFKKKLKPFKISTKGSKKNILCGTESYKNQKSPHVCEGFVGLLGTTPIKSASPTHIRLQAIVSLFTGHKGGVNGQIRTIRDR